MPVRVMIISNGTVLNEKIRIILEKLNFGLMSISVDSVNESLYEELRYPAKWTETMTNLRFFSELMKKKNGKLLTALTINKKNQGEIVNFIRFSQEISAVPFFQFAHNAFKNKLFRKTHEIYSFREHENIKRKLLETKAFLESANLPMTDRNIDYLLACSYYHVVLMKRINTLVSERAPGIKRLLKKIPKR